jgi:flagellar hook protein FlgE
VGRPTTLRVFSQGAIKTSAGNLDAAIQGDGFLIVKDKLTTGNVYTRGGNLQVDKLGNLLTSTGQKVQGWMAANGTLSGNGPLTDIVIPVGELKAPVTTTQFSVDLNLNASATAGPPPDTFSTSIEVYDSLGAPHVLRVDFTKNSTVNVWDYSISVPDTDVSSPITPVTGSITFDGNGRMTDPPVAGPFPQIAITGLNTGASDMTVTWQLFNAAAPRLTQFSQPSAVSANQQDGSPAAQLIRVGIGNGGAVLAQYSNGQQLVVAQLAMASIRNPESLLSVGENTFALSARSALPAVGLPGTGGRGAILGGAVEQSTVDIAREFTNLIVLQRGYQANARVITSVDELSQETINLKR